MQTYTVSRSKKKGKARIAVSISIGPWSHRFEKNKDEFTGVPKPVAMRLVEDFPKDFQIRREN